MLGLIIAILTIAFIVDRIDLWKTRRKFHKEWERVRGKKDD